MILNCPSCGTRFLIDPTLLEPDGRRVRCGRCSHSWYQARTAAVEQAAAPGSSIPRLQEFDEARRRSDLEGRFPALPSPDEEDSRGRLSGLVIGWIALGLFTAAILATLYFARGPIMAYFPETTSLYNVAGLIPMPDAAVEEELGEGLELRDVTSVKRLVDGQQTLLIEGSIVNVSDQRRTIPMLQASVTDATGQQLKQWLFSANGKELPPGGLTTFQTSTESPPKGVNLNLTFVAEGS